MLTTAQLITSKSRPMSVAILRGEVRQAIYENIGRALPEFDLGKAIAPTGGGQRSRGAATGMVEVNEITQRKDSSYSQIVSCAKLTDPATH